MLDKANNNLLDGLFVSDIGDEGVHFRKASSNNIIQNSKIQNCGLERPEYGEGLYIGSALSNWPDVSDSKPDKSNNNKVLRNTFGPGIRAECIDIKEGSQGGLIEGNTFDGSGLVSF